MLILYGNSDDILVFHFVLDSCLMAFLHIYRQVSNQLPDWNMQKYLKCAETSKFSALYLKAALCLKKYVLLMCNYRREWELISASLQKR